jgi:hypothetical protein
MQIGDGVVLATDCDVPVTPAFNTATVGRHEKVRRGTKAEVVDVTPWGVRLLFAVSGHMCHGYFKNNEVTLVYSNALRRRRFWPTRSHERDEGRMTG